MSEIVNIIIELIKRRGIWVIVAFALVIGLIWFIVHSIAEEGKVIKILWFEYTKRGRPTVQSTQINQGDWVFVPPDCPPQTLVGREQAILVGEITNDGGDPNSTVFFQYGKTSVYDYKTPYQSKYGIGLFCAPVYNLEPYYLSLSGGS